MEIDKEKLFEIKSRFFREIPHPKLISKAIRDLGRDINTTERFKDLSWNYSTLSLKEMLIVYIDDVLAFKRLINATKSTTELSSFLASLFDFHNSFITQLAEYAAPDLNLKEFDIKVSIAFDAYQILKHLELNQLQESQIKPYICEQVKLIPTDELDILSISCLRAKKIIENG